MCAAVLREAVEKQRPVLRAGKVRVGGEELQRQHHQREQKVVQFVLIADVGPELRAHRINGCGIEPACTVADGVRE